MNLHAFYNQEHIGDVLLIRLTHIRKVTHFLREDDLCILYHQDKVIGYNLFHASSYISHLSEGKVKITPTFVDDHFRVGKVVEMKEHPDSDHMHICQVDTGDEILQIVCGAPNVALNQLVVVAKNDAVMPSGLVIRPSKLRGIESNGMLCSARELALPNAPQVRGILILDEADYQVGDSFFK